MKEEYEYEDYAEHEHEHEHGADDESSTHTKEAKFELVDGFEAEVVSSQPPQPLNQRQHNMPPQQHQGHGHNHSHQSGMCQPDCTIWMGDLSPEWDAAYIRTAFGKYDETITNVKMVTTTTDQGSKKATYCFVEFRDEESARLAILDVNGKKFPNNPAGRFNLAFANSPNHMQVEYNLFVNNLSPEVDDVSLFRLFGERYRSCRGAKVYRDDMGRSKEQGFVRFTSETDQQKALVEMNKTNFHGRDIFLKLARPKTRGTGRYGPGRGGGGGYGGGMHGGGGGMMHGHGHGQHGGGGMGMGGGMGGMGMQPQMGPGYLVSTAQMPGAGMAQMGLPAGAMQFLMPGAPMALTTPYGTQLAPNHGMAGFGGGGGGMPMPPHQFAGQPLIVGGPGGGFPQGAFIQPQYQPPHHLIHPGQMMAMAPMAMGGAMPFPMGPPHPHFVAPKPPAPLPPPPVYEDVEPLTPLEHNVLVMNQSAELYTSMEASRWNAMSYSVDTRKKELEHMMN